jgi:dolichol-phosphate mannosyltransferase
MSLHYSLVVPCYNEAGNIMPLVAAANEVLGTRGNSCEVILVNDGSTDSTGEEIAGVAARWPSCRELRLAERAGQAAALLAGLREARGEIILTMDGDGQNDPRDFPVLLDLVESGRCDLACGWRVERHDVRWRRVASRLANLIRRAVLADHIHDAGCQLRVMRREVVTALRPMDLLQAFVPALAVAAGFRVAELRVRHHPRRQGRSKYGMAQLWWKPAVAMLRLRWALWRGRRT